MDIELFIKRMTPDQREVYYQNLIAKARKDVANNSNADSARIILALHNNHEQYEAQIKELQEDFDTQLSSLKKERFEEMEIKVTETLQEVKEANERLELLKQQLNF